jgi:hypothetical protein
MLRSYQSALMRRKGARGSSVGWTLAILGGAGPRLGMEVEVRPKQVEEGPYSIGRQLRGVSSLTNSAHL